MSIMLKVRGSYDILQVMLIYKHQLSCFCAVCKSLTEELCLNIVVTL